MFLIRFSINLNDFQCYPYSNGLIMLVIVNVIHIFCFDIVLIFIWFNDLHMHGVGIIWIIDKFFLANCHRRIVSNTSHIVSLTFKAFTYVNVYLGTYLIF